MVAYSYFIHGFQRSPKAIGCVGRSHRSAQRPGGSTGPIGPSSRSLRLPARMALTQKVRPSAQMLDTANGVWEGNMSFSNPRSDKDRRAD
jgi:hypothetical protein